MSAKILYRTISLEISSTDEALLNLCAAEVAKAVKAITDRQLQLSRVRICNQQYCTNLKSGPDLNNPLDRKWPQ